MAPYPASVQYPKFCRKGVREGIYRAKSLYRLGIYTSDYHTVPLDPRSPLNALKWISDLLICQQMIKGMVTMLLILNAYVFHSKHRIH